MILEGSVLSPAHHGDCACAFSYAMVYTMFVMYLMLLLCFIALGVKSSGNVSIIWFERYEYGFANGLFSSC